MKPIHKLINIVALLLAITLLMQCSDDGSNPVDGGNDNQALADSTLNKAAVNTSREIYQSASEGAVTTFDAVYFASVSVGSQTAVVTGTVQQLPGNQGWTYNVQPQDRLRLIYNDGREFDYFVTTITGDFSGSALNFLARDHSLTVRITGADQLDVTVSSNMNNGNRQATISGTFPQAGKLYQANLTVTGTYYFEVDNTGSEYRVNDSYQGTMSTSGFAVTVNETWNYTSVYSTGLDRENSSAVRTINNSWDINGVRYELRNGAFQTSFENGQPNEWAPPLQYWDAQGELFRNDVRIGGLEWGTRSALLLHWLVIGDLRIELQRWLISFS